MISVSGVELDRNGIGDLAGCIDSECREHHTWVENLSFFSGLDGSKQPQDLGVNAHMGARAHVNLGLPLASSGFGFQIGSGLSYHDFAVGVVEAIQGRRERFQSFTTVGAFQRTPGGWKWGVVYDFLNQNYYQGINLGQWRGSFSLPIGECNEFGVWFTVSEHDDSATFLGSVVQLKPIGQANAFWRRIWETGGETTFWLGAAEPHGNEIILFSSAPGSTGTQLVYGADIHLPLNDRLAIFGEANFITPSDSGTVDAYLGAVFYPWGGSGQLKMWGFAI